MPEIVMMLGDLRIERLGHDSFRFRCGELVVYTDPYHVSGEKADLVLITHGHYDHLDTKSLKEVAGSDTVIIAPEAAAPGIQGRVKAIKPNQPFNEMGVKGRAVHAYNVNKRFHPKGVGVGYVFSIGGQTIYHAGDTDAIPEMQALGPIDVALVPVGGTYTMTAQEAAAVVNDVIKPRLSIPMHWGSVVGSRADAEAFKKLVKVGKVEILG
jgi:L-ascorbate metabolism protein UlaG (beta-lactamase superfamily)